MYVFQYYTTISNNVIWYCYMYMWHIWLNEMLPLMSRIVDLFNVSTTCNIKKTEKNKNWGNKTDNHHIFWDVATIICFSFFFLPHYFPYMDYVSQRRHCLSYGAPLNVLLCYFVVFYFRHFTYHIICIWFLYMFQLVSFFIFPNIHFCFLSNTYIHY